MEIVSVDYKKEIIELLNTKKKNMTFKQIKRHFKMNTEEKELLLRQILSELEVDGYLYLNDYDEYQLFEKTNNLVIGEIKCKDKKKPYIVSGNKTIYISDSHLNGAIAGDIVIVKRHNPVKGATDGVVQKILKRPTGKLIFDYIDGDFAPVNWPFSVPIYIPEKELEKLINGSRVTIAVSLEQVEDKYIGQITDYIGHKDDPDLVVKTTIASYGFPVEFSEDSIKQAKSLPTSVTEEEITERLSSQYGKDLRDMCIFTIDGAKTKDIDDAISIQKLPNGNYLHGIHIADVSHYVNPNSPLDLEAKTRGTSVYPYEYVNPMLPHILSNGICSLNPNVDRLSISIMVELDPQGNVVDFNIYDGIIKSRKKMDYQKINDIFERGIMHDDYEPYLHDLALWLELSEKLNKQKANRGYLNFGDNDVDFEVENGELVNIKKDVRGLSEKAIENSMLLANEIVASFIYWFEIPGIYRVHPAPEPKHIRDIIDILKLKIAVPQNLDNPRSLQNIMNKIKMYDEDDIYAEILLQAMKRAVYSPDNIGHFGLALDENRPYTHFTSPIRRYPDLVTHRILRAVRDNILSIDADELQEDLIKVCRQCSAQERKADEVERVVNRYKMVEFMSNHIGENFIGFITHISAGGISVKTDNLIYGTISSAELHNLGYKYNPDMLRYEGSGEMLYLGDKLSITVKTADTESGKIEYSLDCKLEKNKTLVKQKVS